MSMEKQAAIGLVDDDEGMLRALGRLLRTHGYAVRTFDSPDRFLMEYTLADLQCLVLDVFPSSSSLAKGTFPSACEP
jgi:FixJ family two-component response regulator